MFKGTLRVTKIIDCAVHARSSIGLKCRLDWFVVLTAKLTDDIKLNWNLFGIDYVPFRPSPMHEPASSCVQLSVQQQNILFALEENSII
jgi:hypothetical protein